MVRGAFSFGVATVAPILRTPSRISHTGDPGGGARGEGLIRAILLAPRTVLRRVPEPRFRGADSEPPTPDRPDSFPP